MPKKKTHRIYARDENVILDGIKTSRGKVNFGTQTAVYVDEATAKEVDERYGGKSGDVIVAKDEQYERALNGEGWKIQYDSKRGDSVKTLHKWKFQGIDTSHIRTIKDNGLVWVYRGGRQILMKRSKALEEGFEIVPRKRDKRRTSAEVTHDDSG